MNKASRSPQKINTLYNGSPNENKFYLEQQKQIEFHYMKMRQIISEIKYNLSQNDTKNSQNSNKYDFITHFSSQDLKDLHNYIHQNGNSLFLTGQYSEARQLILIGEFIDDELEKRGEIKNSNFASPSRQRSNLVSPIASTSPSAPSEHINYSPTRPKSGILSRKAANKIKQFDDETSELVKQMQARHELLKEEYVSIWEKNMQSHYFQPSKTLQELRKRALTLRKKCIKREEEIKNQNSRNESNMDTSNNFNTKINDEQDNDENQESSDEQKFDDFGDKTLKKLNSLFVKVYQACQQLEAKESEMAQEHYQKDYLESQKKLEEKQMMELEVFLKERIIKRQKLLMNEGVNVNAFKSPPGSKSQLASRKISPMNTRKNSPNKYNNVSKMPPLMSYSRMASRNSTTPETPRNHGGNSDLEATSNALTKEAIMQLTPNITVAIPSSPALIAIEDKIKHNQEKFNKSIKKSNLNSKNTLSPTFRTEKRTQTPSINDNDLQDDADDIELENKPIPFDNINYHKHLPPI